MTHSAVAPRSASIRGALFAAVATLLLVLGQAGSAVVPHVSWSSQPGSSSDGSVAIDPAVHEELARTGSADAIVQASAERVAAARSAVLDAGGAVTRDLPIVSGFAAQLTPRSLRALLGTSGVTAVTLDGEVHVQSETLDADGSSTPYDSEFVEHMRADELHAQGITGAGVGIALIDTGVNEGTDLSGRVVHGVDLSGEGDSVDRYGHGTFIAGVAAGDGSASSGEHAGVAPGAHIVSVKVAGTDGSTDVSNVLAAIQWVVSFKSDHAIGVLNLSIGTDSTQSYTISPLNFAVERAWHEGVVVVVSASNLGPDAGTITKPADDPFVITVGSVASEGTETHTDDTLADFSGRGPTAADGLTKPDLVAPGVSVVGTRAHGSTVEDNHASAWIGDEYMRATGTSFSAAAVSGAVALLQEAHPDWTPDQIKGALMSSAAPGPVGDPNVDGAGSVDVVTAAALVDPAPANQGIVRSDGTGALAAARGSLAISLHASSTAQAKVLDKSNGRTAQDDDWDTWDAAEYRTGEWTASNWYASNWYASNWYASNWYASNWYASNWYASNWY